jgi:hypothetical protein
MITIKQGDRKLSQNNSFICSGATLCYAAQSTAFWYQCRIVVDGGGTHWISNRMDKGKISDVAEVHAASNFMAEVSSVDTC